MSSYLPMIVKLLSMQSAITCCGNSPSSNCKFSKTLAARCRGTGSLSAYNNTLN